MKTVTEVAKKLASVESLSFCHIEMMHNEVDHMLINRAMDYPLLVLFPATSKDSHVNFKWKVGLGKATEAMIIKALQGNAHITFDVPAAAKGEL